MRILPRRVQDRGGGKKAEGDKAGKGGTKDAPVCLNFNKGKCETPCRHGRVHKCSVCGASGHGAFNCRKAGR